MTSRPSVAHRPSVRSAAALAHIASLGALADVQIGPPWVEQVLDLGVEREPRTPRLCTLAHGPAHVERDEQREEGAQPTACAGGGVGVGFVLA